ncbi:type I-F CRISPR-associated protein Csy2 [Methylophaga thalassica]|uniref:type I-F CRISPR-associated protein Csy2 n=1 Tax=Methylophaga thalassica TaxID=40223 RepID=UPI002E7BE319|nr:type I-F CRISPR-associated protein Csy2 [Methylophaga thalassica]WVI86633.1 type I-F CRISPR-associated protein Csy2 [Methylophaga thalassica]
MTGEIKDLLIIPHIKIHNANALSSPFTIGFPAMTAWLGAVHALQRKLNDRDIAVIFSATGVVSHDMELQTYKGDNDFVHSIIGTGNPLDKTGERSAFIEEARCHLDVSLVIQLDNSIELEDADQLIANIEHLLHSSMKMAGGDIEEFKTPFYLNVKDGDSVDMARVKGALMPGYALIERRELMIDAMEKGMDALDALIDYLAIHHRCEIDDEDNITRTHYRKTRNNEPAGWLVPIATGFHGISDLGEAKNQRDAETPHRFAESVVTLGEFKMLHRIQYVEDILWRYGTDGDLYLCQQKNQSTQSSKLNPADHTIESEF